ncbi:MAG: phytanoyl-CoA dioxygenase family protein [Chitinophagales bacterium]|nr:phytanoyl-CoA dioxygenase family protein [Chitinophagales bacterium]
MQQLILDEKLNKDFFEKGFAKFQLFSEEQVDKLRGFYFQHAFVQKKEGVYFNTTSNSGDIDLVKKTSQYLLDNYFRPELKKHLCNFQLTLSNYLVKESGKDSAVSAHQDWLLVDESKHVSFNCWVCLEDANYNTGNMQFIPGSHRFQNNIRVAHTDRFFDRIATNISNYMIDIPTKAGECVVFSHAIVHASRKNKSGHPRIAVVAGGYTDGADLLFYYRENKEQELVEKYLIQTEDLLNMQPNERPQNGKLIEELVADIYYPSDKEFKEMCLQQINPSYILRNKLINFFIGSSN